MKLNRRSFFFGLAAAPAVAKAVPATKVMPMLCTGDLLTRGLMTREQGASALGFSPDGKDLECRAAIRQMIEAMQRHGLQPTSIAMGDNVRRLLIK